MTELERRLCDRVALLEDQVRSLQQTIAIVVPAVQGLERRQRPLCTVPPLRDPLGADARMGDPGPYGDMKSR